MSYKETIREVTVEGGRLRGIRGNNPVYTVFKGIPYAAPPVGELRWKAPQPVIPWEGTKVCFEYGMVPEQGVRYEEPLYGREFFQNTEARGEDCLFLNVWTPAKSADEKLPVFFWIHGGGYFGGYGNEPEFDGEGFCRRGIIMVSINYRLGSIGFLAHPELSAENPDGVSGNYGTLDQIAALKWVRRNIAAFGGDPDNITICGQSAGAGSVQTLMISPLSQGEFKRAIVQSGIHMDAGIIPGLTREEAEADGIEFMREHNCTSIDELRKISSSELVKNRTSGMSMRFRPIPDGVVLPDETPVCLKNGTYADVDYMIGNTADEGRGETRKQILSPGNKAFAINHEKLGRKPVYTYCFSRQIPGEDNPGAFHAGELWYQFETLNRCWRPFVGLDFDISTAMADYFANFIKTGNPGGVSGVTGKELSCWEPFDSAKPGCMEIGEHIGMIATD